MVDRKLRSHTIIPPALYLRRHADDQLREIINEMGRPGYVLVARQMGKTNLLLNARRELPEKGDLFVYLDVSNLFPELRGFFRNLIDVALESLRHDGVFLQGVIQQSRAETASLPPHKEHEIELRRLLQTVSGKVVVFLDEVDALTKTGYSDQVFSFIRSVYFAGRANFEEFTRLTFILSGVAEPGELIQNKSVSPFNIGEKIYLDDFSRAEFDRFLIKAELNYSEEVSSRVFYWVEGHPRMTWDLCSALERRSQEKLTEVDVDDEVSELYFGSVNVPPIDHIKDLVAQSNELRDSVMTIHYRKTDALTDPARTRLYLAGISRFDIQKRIASFKNRVIERALSEDFIRSIATIDTAQIDAGVKLFQVEQFADALGLFNSIARGASDPRLKNSAIQWAGLAQFQLGKFSDALTSFESQTEIEDSEKLVHWYFRGLSHLNLGEYENSISCFRSALSSEKSERVYYFDTMANLGTALAMLDPPSQTSLIEANQLSRELISKVDKIKSLNTKSGSGVLVTAYRTLSRVARLEGNHQGAREYLESAKKYADAPELLKLTMMEVTLADRASRAFVLDQAVQVVLSIKSFSLSSLENQFALKEVGSLLELLDAADKRDEAASIVGHVLDHVTASEQLMNVIEEVVFSTFSRGFHTLGAALIQKMLERDQIKRIPITYKSILTFATLVDERMALQYGDAYVLACEKSRDRVSDDVATTLRGLFAVFSTSLRHGKLDLAEDASRVAGEIIVSFDFASSSMPSALLLRDFMSVLVTVLRRRDIESAAVAGALIRKVASVKQFELPMFPNDFHRNMQRDLAHAMRTVPVGTVVKSGKKYGRNSRVIVSYDGEERSGKYKVFADDVEAGKCVVLREYEQTE